MFTSRTGSSEKSTRHRSGGRARLFARLAVAVSLTASGVALVGSPATADGCTAAGSYAGGTGTEGDKYQIATTEQLLRLSETTGDWGAHFVQTQPIDLTGCTWATIGDGSIEFEGSYDGGDNTITGLTIAAPAQDYVGMFGYAVGATLTGIRLEGVDVEGRRWVGGLVGYIEDGVISDSHVTGQVIARISNQAAYVGGLVGYASNESGSDIGTTISSSSANVTVSGAPVSGYSRGIGGLVGQLDGNSTIDKSFASGAVSGLGDDDDWAGGLVGRAYQATISASHATGDVSSTGGDAGGLVGEAEEVTIINSYATGDVTSDGNDYVGGLVGDAGDVTITNSYATGAVSGSYAVGGLVGYADEGSITDSYATGDVTGTSSNVGGLVGENYTAITDSYAEGNVTSTGNDYVGGLVGSHDNYYGEDYIVRSYATGNVVGGSYVGGLIGGHGYDYEVAGDIIDSYATGTVLGEGGDYVGGLIGYHYGGDITDSYAEGNVTGNSEVGGLVGYIENFSTITDSHATGDVTASGYTQGGSRYGPAGGLVGYFEGEIRDSYAEGAVSGIESVGGLVGYVRFDTASKIIDSYATGNVAGVEENVGGLVGYLPGSGDDTDNYVARSYATGAVTAQGGSLARRVGGLIGESSGYVSQSYATGTVSAAGYSAVGGLVGENYGEIEDSYALGAVTGGSRVGGLAGYNEDTITNSFSIGLVTGTTDVGGLVGDDDGGEGTATASFWDTVTSGQATSEGGEGKTTVEMKAISTFTGWDISEGDAGDTIWGICAEANDGYPYLRWQSALEADSPGALSCTEPGPGPGPDPDPDPTPTPTPGPAPAPVPGGLEPIDPVRVVDTRGTGPVTGGEVLAVPLSPPTGAIGAVLNVTAVDAGGALSASLDLARDATAGFATVYPCEQDRPNASNLNYTTGQAVPNAVITGIGANGQVCVYVSETTNLLVDVMAWFTKGFTQVAPTRLLETRQTGGVPGRVAAGSVTRVRTTGVAGVPVGAVGVALNVTTVNAASTGFVSVYPCGEARPNTSSVNYTAGSTVANLIVTAADAAGDICVYSSAATDVLVDVFGWFTNVFQPVANTRLLDTRSGSGPVAAGSVTRVRVAGAGPIPAGARSVTATVTAVNPSATGFVTVYPCEATRPNTSNSNPTAGSTVANSVFIGLDATGELCIYTSVATDLLVDVSGWFTSNVAN